MVKSHVSRTTLEDVALNRAVKYAEEDPAIYRALREQLEQMRAGDEELVAWYEIVGQRWRGAGRRYDLGDALTCARISSAIHRGEMLLSRFVVNAEPAPNVERDENRARLATLHVPLAGSTTEHSAYLWEPFTDRDEYRGPVVRVATTFEGAAGESGDGTFELLTDLPAQSSSGVKHVQKPWPFVLEVGTTSHAMTWLHLVESRGVARWAYGHNEIVLLHATSNAPPLWDYPYIPDYAATARGQRSRN